MRTKTKAGERNLLDVVFQVSDRIAYEVDENGIVTVLEKQDHPIQRFFRKLKVKIPAYRRISLDAYGSYVFLQVDGSKTVRQIGEALQEKFGETVNPLYERLSLFLQHVCRVRHYITEAPSQAS